jgi:hypothetical protein
MEIVAALFVENINFRPVAGPSTRIDITGAYFSTAVAEFPFRTEPHLAVLVRCPPGHPGAGVLETAFVRLTTNDSDGEQVAFNRQVFTVEPGKFGYRLVRAELEFAAPGTIEARCSTTDGSRVNVSLTVIPLE